MSIINGTLYQAALSAARSELDALLTEESTLETRLREVRERSEACRKTVMSLSAMVGEDGTDEKTVGITDALRAFLKASSNNKYIWSPTNLRNRLKTEGFPWDKYENFLAVIHTTLKRLEEQGEVKSVQKDSKTYYQWIEKEEDDIPF